MNTPHDAAQRLDQLEIKASYAEDLLEQLNLLVYQQQQQIENLQQRIEHLRQQIPARDPGLDAGPRDERPPHY